MKPSECMGCRSYHHEGKWCVAISYIHIEAENIKSCACATCLVKVMCVSEACEEFFKARKPERR